MNPFRRCPASGILLAVCLPVLHAAAAGEIDFSRDIRPLLSDNCFACHGPDAGKRQAGLRLDIREGATAAHDGMHAVVPGHPEASELIRRLIHADPEERMPPPDSGKRLTSAQIDLLRRWIQEGATWADHWAFRPVEHPEPPSVRQTEWPRNGIDHFILARLEQAGLPPSPEADRHTLIRRVYLDLVGLLPDPETVASFVKDRRPDAYERLVEALLKNPHYGERWGRHWLDQARYADSNGYTFDNPRTMWPYRDWVIEAHNRDLPFDRFTIEQLAGDLLPGATRDQRIATGFHRNTLINEEGGTDPEQFRVEATVDRINTTGAVWLGLTLGCAQCHDHKFDPVSQREYYQMYAYFNGAADRNSRAPQVSLPSAEQQRKQEELAGDIRALKQRIAALEKAAVAEAGEPEERLKQRLAAAQWTAAKATSWKSLEGATLLKLEDGSLLAKEANPDHDVYQTEWVTAASVITRVRLDCLTHESLVNGGPGRSSAGNFVLTAFEVETAPKEGGDFVPVKLAAAAADREQPTYGAAEAINGNPADGWAPEGYRIHEPAYAVFRPAEPIRHDGGIRLRIRLRHDSKYAGYGVGRFLIQTTATDEPVFPNQVPLEQALAKAADQRTDEQRQLIARTLGVLHPDVPRLTAELKKVEAAKQRIDRAVTTALVMGELPKPRETRIMIRGDFLRLADAVQPLTPKILPGIDHAEGQGTRLDLARWLVDPANPLTPRVTVNRIWMQYFGLGLVETENDFGMQSTPPSHPRLLDWLASEFIRQGWSMKALHRLIVTSATYRQASSYREDVHRADPRNRLLGRQNRLRVTAEVVRDLALSASGLLNPEIGGPSVFPPQPEGVYAFTQKKKNWTESQGPDRYRRGLYTFFYRSAPHPLLATFDTPNFNTTCTRRVRSNTPLQALTVANDAAMAEFARGLAYRVLREEPDSESARLGLAWRLCLVSPPETEAVERLQEFLGAQRAAFQANPAAAAEATSDRPKEMDAVEAATWTAVARVLLNLDLFITRD